MGSGAELLPAQRAVAWGLVAVAVVEVVMLEAVRLLVRDEESVGRQHGRAEAAEVASELGVLAVALDVRGVRRRVTEGQAARAARYPRSWRVRLLVLPELRDARANKVAQFAAVVVATSRVNLVAAVGVALAVRLEIVTSREGGAAGAALVRLDARVQAGVALEVVASREGGETHVAREARVSLQVVSLQRQHVRDLNPASPARQASSPAPRTGRERRGRG